jgi:PAS domain S-box-containing protein
VATLQAVTDQLNSVTDIEVGAQLALSLVLKVTNAEAGVLVWTIGDGKRPPVCVSQGSLGELVVSRRDGLSPERWWDEQTLQGVIQTGRPLLAADLRLGGNGPHSQARSRLAVPMRRGKRVVGALNLESSSPNAFTQDDLQFVLNITDQVTVALEGTALEERAETERERLSLLMEAVDNAVWVVDTDLRLMAQNQVASEMLGWSVAECIGRSVYELASTQRSSDGLCQLLNQAIEKRQPVVFPKEESLDGHDILLETRDGRSIPVRGRGVPLIRDGRAVGVICAFREVRPKKGDELVRFEFANMASHLLRSPLSFIQASIDLMLNSELDVEEQRTMLSRMWEQGQRIREFIKDLLEMSRLESGLVPTYLEPVVLPRLIERVLDLVRPEEPSYAFRFVAPGTFPIVAADPGKTELVVLSLLRSAMNRCPKGGCISLDLETRASEAVVFVTDDGEPILPKQLERIFSQFYPVDDDGNKMPSTYQLGLYTTKRLVELQNGHVWAESQPGKGTRFGFSLPVWG